jgi:Pyruvate/2-oxoacid:ferredoxin oxidoreductase delta subunit
VEQLECLRTTLSGKNKDGRYYPEQVEGSNFFLRVNTIIPAVGETVDISFLPAGIEMQGNVIKVDNLGRTSIPGIFAGGDAANSEWNVSQAIGSGKKAALGIDLFLKNSNSLPVSNYFPDGKPGSISMEKYLAGENPFQMGSFVDFENLNMNYFVRTPRIQRAELPVSEREVNFNEIRVGLSAGEVAEEAQRCFQCGQCTLCENCFIFCPDRAITFSKMDFSLEVDEKLCKGCGICIKECPRQAIEWKGYNR